MRTIAAIAAVAVLALARRDGSEVDFEAEIDDGRVKIEVCHD